MANTLLESQVISHLEFLGYEVKRVPDADTERMRGLRAEHPSRGSVNVGVYERLVAFSI